MAKKKTLIQLAGREADRYTQNYDALAIDRSVHHQLTRFMKLAYMAGYRAAQRKARKGK